MTLKMIVFTQIHHK